LGNVSWLGVCLGMIVLDTLSGGTLPVGKRFKKLLTDHDVDQDDADIIWAVRCALLHGYGLPKPNKVRERHVAFPSRTLRAMRSTPAARRMSCSAFQCSVVVWSSASPQKCQSSGTPA
jgi:hypothetical protein